MRKFNVERLFRCGVCALLLAFLLDTTAYAIACDTLPEQVLRLHVVANSDSGEDQAEKLLVRDALLTLAETLCRDAETPFAVQSILCVHMETLEAAANAALQGAGSEHTARLRFVDAAFPARTYGGVTLPAGEYRALRVTIGAGEGKNWWCVLFPSLCLPCGGGMAFEEALTPAQREVTAAEGITVRFKLVEWLRFIVNSGQRGQCPPPSRIRTSCFT